MSDYTIPFYRFSFSGREVANIAALIETGDLHTGGRYSAYCRKVLQQQYGAAAVLLTPSATHALEMSALLLGIAPGDEVIIPAFTHYSTANAFLLRGAQIVCVDIDERTLNIDIEAVGAVITPRTRAVVPVHYGGISCDMDRLTALPDIQSGRIALIEDAALAYGAEFGGTPLGGIGQFGCLSFHSAKNVHSGGEGGALIIRDSGMAAQAEIIQEMGTDRARFREKAISSYTWRGTGSSYLMNELSAAYLAAQLDYADTMQKERLRIWEHYQDTLEGIERYPGYSSPPCSTSRDRNNGHSYYIRVPRERRAALQAHLASMGIETATHYQVLSGTPFGSGNPAVRFPIPVSQAERAAAEILRLPIYPGLPLAAVDRVCTAILSFAAGGSRES